VSRTTPATVQRRIVKMATAGNSDATIAAAMNVSRETVRRYRIGAGVGVARMAAGEPFGPSGIGGPGRPNAPDPSWTADQPPPPETPTRFRRGYHDYTFRHYNPQRTIGGWDEKRKDRAIEMHDQGIFLESSTLAKAARRYAPVHTAMMLRRAPVLFLDRKIRRAARGFARIVGQEIEDQLADRGHGEQPSPTFPPELWGSIEDDLGAMGFCILQHAYSVPDRQGSRLCFSRRWPTEAVRFYRYRKQFVADTFDGPVDIINGDGKWSIIAKSDEPMFDGWIRSTSSEYMSGAFARASMDNYIDEYGDPKWVGYSPEGVGPNTPEGLQFSDALSQMHEPGAWVEFPYSAKAEVVQLDAKTSTVFMDADRLSLRNILTAILGSEGGIEKNTGVYTPESIMGVRYDVAADDLAAITRGINYGRIRPSNEINYAATMERERDAGRWVDPVLEIELPDAELDARTAAIAKRMLDRAAIRKADAESGVEVDQEAEDMISGMLELPPGRIVSKRKGGQIFEYHIVNKQVATDEVREDLGLEALPGGAGSKEQLAEERMQGKDKVGLTKVTEDKPTEEETAGEEREPGDASGPGPKPPASPSRSALASVLSDPEVVYTSIGRKYPPRMWVKTAKEMKR
jgi:hypothetical protein